MPAVMVRTTAGLLTVEPKHNDRRSTTGNRQSDRTGARVPEAAIVRMLARIGNATTFLIAEA